MNLMPLWWEQGALSNPETSAAGRMKLPAAWTDRRCLDGTQCEERETLKQMQERVAEDHLDRIVKVIDDGEHWMRWENFVGAVR